jgi:HPt (histidine-containing phosphotransfer) domain-containing protein
MDGFVSKPVPQAALYAAIEEQLSTAAAPGSELVVDWPAALLQAGGDHQQLAERAALLMQEIPRVERELIAAAAAGDSPALKIAAHTIKVALGGFGAPRIAQLAEQLEASAPSGDLATVNDLVATFQEEAQRLQKALQQFLS